MTCKGYGAFFIPEICISPCSLKVEDTNGEKTLSVFTVFHHASRNEDTDRNDEHLYFTMLFYMKIQTERKHHAFVFHHAHLYEDTDGEETLCVCISPCFFI
jgi:hypothetical protein